MQRNCLAAWWLGVSLLVCAAAQAADRLGAAAYLEGLEALEQGKWSAAVEALDKACAAERENADYLLARGVAGTLAEKFPQALKDLLRALKIREGHRETRLWLAAAYRMSGDPAKGAQFFTHGEDVPADYASLVYNDMAMDYWQSTRDGGKLDKALFGRVAARFAERAKGAPGASSAVGTNLAQRAKQRFDAGDFAAAQADLAAILRSKPDDAATRQLLAWCQALTGDAENARREFTRQLTAQYDSATCYQGRSLASLRMGDVARAKADLGLAERYDAASTRTFLAGRGKDLAALPAAADPPPDVAPLVQRLIDAAKSGASVDDLIEPALAVRRAMHARRLRHDEWYQDRLRTLEEAVREKPRDVATLTDLAEFLHRQASVKRVQVEPRGQPRMLRYQTTAMQDAELKRAEQLADQVIAQEPRAARALTVKAAVRMWYADFAAVRPLLHELLNPATPRDPHGAVTVVWLIEAEAGRQKSVATGLRSTTLVDIEHRYESTVYWYRSPSRAELAQAEELERQANELIRQGLDYLRGVAAEYSDQAIGDYVLAAVKRREKDAAGVLAALQRAVERDPAFVDAHLQLADVLWQQGKIREALDARSRGLNLLETTAGIWLSRVWVAVPKTLWDTADDAIAQARSLDPADPRWTAYRGVVALADEKPDEAAAAFRMALALEEARARLTGTSFGRKSQDVRDGEEFGLTIGLRLALARLVAEKKPTEALELLQANLEFGRRVPRATWANDVISAMLPNPDIEPSEIPQAKALATLGTWSQLHAAQIQIGLKQTDPALRGFQAIYEYAEGPELSTSPAKAQLQEPRAWAALGLAQHYIAQGDGARARQWLSRSGSWVPAAEKERKRLEAQLRGQ